MTDPADLSARKYRKKPVVVEAMRYTDEAAARAIVAWIDGGSDVVYYAPGIRCVAICTLEGVMHASVGDYVIHGVAGEFYPCKPDIFEATYEPAD